MCILHYYIWFLITQVRNVVSSFALFAAFHNCLISLVGRRAPHAPKRHVFLIIIFELPNMYTFRILMFPRPKMVEMTPAGPKLTKSYYKGGTLTTSIFGYLYI